MCVFDLDDETPQQDHHHHDDGTDEHADLSYPPGCHDVYSHGLFPFVFRWLTAGGCDASHGRGGSYSPQSPPPPQPLDTEASNKSETSTIPRARESARLEHRSTVLSVSKASTFLYAPCDHSIETIFVSVCLCVWIV
jgi:hypothetical protein